MMFRWTQTDVFWLNVTNAAFGIITLAFLVLVIGAVVVEIALKSRKGV